MTEPDNTVALVQSIVENAQRLGLIWTFQFCTVVDGRNPKKVTVNFDDSDAPIDIVSVVGRIVNGSRVAVISVPPAGQYIIGVPGGNDDSWHLATLLNGWTNQTPPAPPAQYKLSMFDQTVQLSGEIAAGTIASGTTIFVLPVGYRPLTRRITFPVAVNPSPAAGAVGPLIQILTNGNVTLWGATSASSVYFNTTFPINNI